MNRVLDTGKAPTFSLPLQVDTQTCDDEGSDLYWFTTAYTYCGAKLELDTADGWNANQRVAFFASPILPCQQQAHFRYLV